MSEQNKRLLAEAREMFDLLVREARIDQSKEKLNYLFDQYSTKLITKTAEIVRTNILKEVRNLFRDARLHSMDSTNYESKALIIVKALKEGR